MLKTPIKTFVDFICGFAETLGYLAAIAAVFIMTITFLLKDTLYSKWIHGWGTACDAVQIHDELSPSKSWIARRQIVECSGMGSGSLSADVVLVRAHSIFPFLAREHQVLTRDLRDDQFPVEVKWVDDRNLKIITAKATNYCGDPCGINHSLLKGNSPKSCDLECKITTPVEGINVTLVSSDGNNSKQ